MQISRVDQSGYSRCTESELQAISGRARHHRFIFFGLFAVLLVILSSGAIGVQPVYAAATWTSAASMSNARFSHTATLLPNGEVLVAGGINSAVMPIPTNSVESHDPDMNIWTSAANLNAARSQHTATLLLNGKVLVVGGQNNGTYLTSAEVYDPGANTWTTVASMNTARYGHTATLLPNGKVLIAGGANGGILASAEVYDPTANTWATIASMSVSRSAHTTTLLPNGKALVIGGQTTNTPFVAATAEVYDPTANTWTAAASPGAGRYSHAATLLSYGNVLVAGGNGGSGALFSAQVYDPGANTWTTVASMNAAREGFTATLLPNSRVLVGGGSGLSSSEVYDAGANTWTPSASLIAARASHTSTLLPNGKVFVAGGLGSDVLVSAELYSDPAAGSWTTVASLSTGRYMHAATLLPNGKVLVAGGTGASSSIASVEVYDPGLNTWAAAASMNTARNQHTMTLLPSGKVLVVGGYNIGTYHPSVELYDPGANTWTYAASMSGARDRHTATLLPNGKVLVAGGYNGSSYPTSVQAFDPDSNIWTTVAPMNTGRQWHTATLLTNGKVLVAGGCSGTTCLPVTNAQVQVYDPGANTWTTAASMNTARTYHTATLLPNGKVLVAGGYNGSSSLTSAEVYDPVANSWTTVASMNAARIYHTATLLTNGKVLAAGGGTSATAEVYDPGANTWTAVAVMNSKRQWHTATPLPNGKVLVAGGSSTGFDTLTSVVVYDRGLGFGDWQRPTLNPVPSALTLGDALSLTGAGFRGVQYEEGSGGSTNNSATNYPLVQIRRLDNEQWIWLSPASFSNTIYTSLPVTGITAGPALATVFVNGIPGMSQPLTMNYATNASLNAPAVTYKANGVVTVSVTSVDAFPVGLVTLSVDGGALFSQTLVPVYGSSPLTATATFTLIAPLAGNHTLSVNYAAQGNMAASSASGALSVSQAATTTAVASSVNPSRFGQNVTLTAAVTSSAGTPTGTVTFKDGAATLGTTALASGIATLNIATLSAGSHAITATYNGDTNYTSSNGTLTGGQTVNASNVVVMLLSSSSPISSGQIATFTALVGTSGVQRPNAPATCALTGTVTFKEGAASLGSVSVDGSCQAVFTTTTLSVATHTLTAEYGGNANFGSGVSNPVTMVVNPILTLKKEGTGTGTMSVNPGALSEWVSNTATAAYTSGALVMVSAEAYSCSIMSGWGGTFSCTGGSPCSVSMTDNWTVSATFTQTPVIENHSNSDYPYAVLQTALSAGAEGNEILVQSAYTGSESLVHASGNSLLLSGGYDCNFSSGNRSMSRINSLSIEGGGLTLDNIQIGGQ